MRAKISAISIGVGTCELTGFQEDFTPKRQAFVRYFRVAWKGRFIVAGGKPKVRECPLLMYSELSTMG